MSQVIEQFVLFQSAFFFSSRRRHTRFSRDWSSDVCSSDLFTTAADNQTQVEINVLQGEGETVQSPAVHSLGRFNLVGIPPAPRGVPQIEVSFDIDANGIVNVNAKDMATGKEQAMKITGGTALSKDEIDRMVKEAESFADKDHERREAAEDRNQADQLADAFEMTLDLPGIEPSAVSVNYEDGMLTISGKRDFSQEEKGETWHRIERSFGAFARSVRLPRTADADGIEARFEKGVLTISVPK